MQAQWIHFAIHSDWHIGSGEEGGAYADALVLKTSLGLPYVPGKSVKGLFREAFEVAVANGWFDVNGADTNQILACLFGLEGNRAATQGLLQFSSATLSPVECAYFSEHRAAIRHLYRVHQSTAIDAQTGVTKNTSLRSIEVAIPMTLTAQVTADSSLWNDKAIADWPIERWLSQCGCLILALGAKRHRGMGRVQVSVSAQGAAQ